MDITGGRVAPERLVCSARGCRQVATWALGWNNPSLHTPDRRKTWLACDAHRDSLSSFLSVRGFLRETVPAAELPAAELPAAGPPAAGPPAAELPSPELPSARAAGVPDPSAADCDT